MYNTRFEWDAEKSAENKRKRDVSFFDTHHIGQKSEQERTKSILGGGATREHYDFEQMKGKKNPYAKAEDVRVMFEISLFSVQGMS